MKFKTFITKPFVLILISAILSAIPLTFSGLFFLSWISFVPLFYVIIKHSGDKLRHAFGRGFLFGFVYHLCIYYWFLWFYPVDYAELSNGASIAVVALAWFGISAVHGVLWCIPTILCHLIQRLNKNPLFLSLTAMVGIIAAQKMTALSELSFPWTRLSLGQYKATVLIQGAAVFGIDGVDMLILCINAFIAICIISPPKKRAVAAVLAATLFLSNLIFGLIRLQNAPDGKNLTVMAVQGSVSPEDKWSVRGDEICYDVYSTLTKENITQDVQLVLWPESAVPTVYYYDNAARQYGQLVEEIDKPIIVGVLQQNYGAGTNDALLIDQDGNTATYTKRQLVPFGEYMPYRKVLASLFPFLVDLNIIEDDYVSGTHSAIMKTENGNIGNIICFESIYPELSRQSTLDGAELLIEVTNDSWLEDSPAMRQHLAHGVFRSVENGRYLVRAANSGISATIDSRGRVRKELGVDEKGAIIDTVSLNNETTLYTKIGDVLFPASIVLLLMLCIIFLIKHYKNKKTAEI